MYGAGDSKIGSIVGGSDRVGKKLKEQFLDNTPALKALREKITRLSKKGWLPGLDGRRLYVRSEHAALNTLLQGAGAVVMKKALCILYDDLLKAKIPHGFTVNCHDEWQIETKPEYGEEVGMMAVKAIEKAGEELQMRCPLTGEYRVGSSWLQTH